MVPHRGTNWAVLWLTLQIGRDAVLSESYGRGCLLFHVSAYESESGIHTFVSVSWFHPSCQHRVEQKVEEYDTVGI